MPITLGLWHLTTPHHWATDCFIVISDTAYVTKVHCAPVSDTFFPNLDEDPQWKLESILQSGEENGISYEMCRYIRK